MIRAENILRGMESVGLDGVASHALMNRVDTKYVFGVDRLDCLLERVRDEYRVLQTQGQLAAPYVTLYFDTGDHECYLRHHNDQRTRHKVRIRQYRSTGAAFLEVKAKDNKGRTRKSRVPVEGLRDALASDHQAFVDDATRSRFVWEPKLLTEFRRITLVRKQCRERATIDIDLAFSRNDASRALPRLVVAEVKQETGYLGSPLRDALKEMRARPTRMSKYCIGSAMLNPALKRNRFKHQLRAILKHTGVE